MLTTNAIAALCSLAIRRTDFHLKNKNMDKKEVQSSLNGYYVIIGKKGNVHYHTFSCQRKTCIEKFLDGGMMTWKDCRELGWKCLKVDVSFKPCK